MTYGRSFVVIPTMKALFEEFSEAERAHAFACLGVQRRHAETGELLFHEGEAAGYFGIILSGSVNVVRYSLDGRARVLSHLTAGESFGTSFVLGGATSYFGNIEANEPTDAMLLDGSRLLSPCSTNCKLHTRLLAHLLEALARRNIALAKKIDCLTQRTTAEKLLAYLKMQSEASGNRSFTIPFTRQQLADYLNVDRAALSTEIGKLVKSGVLETIRKRFRLH